MAASKGKLWLIVFLLALAVFYGLDMANRGMERVQGPVGTAGQTKQIGQDGGSAVKNLAATAGDGDAADAKTGRTFPRSSDKKDETALEPPIIVKESFINHVSNRIGDALRRGAKAILGLVVSLFDSITG